MYLEALALIPEVNKKVTPRPPCTPMKKKTSGDVESDIKAASNGAIMMKMANNMQKGDVKIWDTRRWDQVALNVFLKKLKREYPGIQCEAEYETITIVTKTKTPSLISRLFSWAFSPSEKAPEEPKEEEEEEEEEEDMDKNQISLCVKITLRKIS